MRPPAEAAIRILIVSPMLPAPPVDGGRIRVHGLARGLAARGHRVEVLALAGSHEDAAGASAAMSAEGVRLTPVPHRGGRAGAAARALVSRASLHSALVRSADLAAAVARRVADGVDVVQCEYAYTGWLLGQVPAGPLRVLDEHNVEHRLAGVGVRGLPRPLAAAYAARERLARRREERDACAAADLVLAVSEDDRRELLALGAGSRVEVVPNGVDTARFRPEPEAVDSHDVVFVGKVDYGPNADGIAWFGREVWPEVRRRVPDATLTVVGSSPAPPVRDLAHLPGVTVTGFVPDTRPHLRDAALAVVPLRSGSGTRLKVLEAAASGRAVVATGIGAAGIALPPDAIRLADTAADFADAVAGLLRDPAGRAAMAAAAADAARADYSWDGIAARLEGLLEEARA